MSTTIDTAKRAAVAVALTLTAVAGAAPALPGPAAAVGAEFVAAPSPYSLPGPSGPFATGREVLHLVDRSRRDPWVPERSRELMVSLFFPAASSPGRPVRYLTTTEARLLIDDRGATGAVDPADLSATRTASGAGAQPRRGRYPLVVLSPGFTLHRHTLTLLAEELASRGYLVATVDHAYESVGTAFPGGRVLPFTARTATDYAKAATGRARDISFVLDRVTFRYAPLIDRARIGAAGHSLGGNAAAATMAIDPRVRAGVNMDGTFFDRVPADGLDGRPFLMLGAADHVPGHPVDRSWDEAWQALDGWKRWLTVTGSGHLDFTDIPIIADQAGLPDPGYPLPGDRAARITRDYVGAFFDLHLKGIPQPLFDGPAPTGPEVVFQKP